MNNITHLQYFLEAEGEIYKGNAVDGYKDNDDDGDDWGGKITLMGPSRYLAVQASQISIAEFIWLAISTLFKGFK